MANEIVLTGGLNVTKSGVTVSANGSKTIDMSGDQLLGNVQIIGTVTEALSFVDVVTIGYVYVKNLDTTNFIEIGLVTAVTSGNALITLKAGEFAVFPTRQTVIYAKADTAPCNLQIVMTEL
jgi:hypothetical protein